MRIRSTGRARPPGPLQRARPLTGLAVSMLAMTWLASCSVSDLLSPRPDMPLGGGSPVSGAHKTAAPATAMIGYPRLTQPLAGAQATLPADEVACRRQLRRIGVQFRDLPPIVGGGGCGIDHPVEVSGFSGSIALKPAATLSCAMALGFARWTKHELAPAARLRYLSGIDTIHQGSSYSCRRIRGSGTLSEHARGNALDVMKIALNNGREIDVRKPGWFAFRQRAMLNSVRSDACAYFTTVLGPGYDADHKDHFHFDIKPRKNGYRACR